MLPRQILTEKLDWEFFSVDEGATCFAKCGDALYIGARQAAAGGVGDAEAALRRAVDQMGGRAQIGLQLRV